MARAQGSGGIRHRLQNRHTVRTHISTSITIRPSFTGLRGTQLTGSIIYTLVSYRWRGDDEVNDRPVGKPQEEGMMNIAASFSLSKKPRFMEPVGKSQTQEGDAC
jgi:hypothetical protein